MSDTTNDERLKQREDRKNKMDDEYRATKHRCHKHGTYTGECSDCADEAIIVPVSSYRCPKHGESPIDHGCPACIRLDEAVIVPVSPFGVSGLADPNAKTPEAETRCQVFWGDDGDPCPSFAVGIATNTGDDPRCKFRVCQRHADYVLAKVPQMWTYERDVELSRHAPAPENRVHDDNRMLRDAIEKLREENNGRIKLAHKHRRIIREAQVSAERKNGMIDMAVAEVELRNATIKAFAERNADQAAALKRAHSENEGLRQRDWAARLPEGSLRSELVMANIAAKQSGDKADKLKEQEDHWSYALKDADEKIIDLQLRLRHAREALISTGYFKEDEVDDDIAPGIIEMHAKLTFDRDAMTEDAIKAKDESEGLKDRIRATVKGLAEIIGSEGQGGASYYVALVKAKVEKLKLQVIELRNPGIDLDKVREQRCASSDRAALDAEEAE